MRKIILLSICTLFIFPLRANVIINATRIIFPAGSKSVSVQLINKSKEQHLIQTWIDDGRQNEKPESISTPFMIIPPVVKINGNDGQVLKINHNHQVTELPDDRESVFWLNVLDIPPTPESLDTGKNYMQFAIRNRIKLFWRPEKLNFSPRDIPQHLSIISDSHKACVDNATPYYLTVIQLMKWDGKSHRIQQGKKQDNLIDKTLFIPPFSCLAPADKSFRPASGKYQLVYIDDYGSRVPVIAVLK